MQIKIFCPRWGCEYISWDDFCKKVKDAGFDGVETPIPFESPERQKIISALKEHGLLLIVARLRRNDNQRRIFNEPWGKGANQAVNAAKLGAAVTFPSVTDANFPTHR